jgi:DNA-binding YbaB/EbfC family protein
MAKGGYRGNYRGGGGGSQMNFIKKTQKLQQEFLQMQKDLESRKYEATAGGGAVKATMLGSREFESIEIDPEAVDPDDIEMLQDMILAAVNEALRQSDEATNEAMSKMSGGANMPF